METIDMGSRLKIGAGQGSEKSMMRKDSLNQAFIKIRDRIFWVDARAVDFAAAQKQKDFLVDPQ